MPRGLSVDKSMYVFRVGFFLHGLRLPSSERMEKNVFSWVALARGSSASYFGVCACSVLCVGNMSRSDVWNATTWRQSSTH